jgi:hypothetical protein
MTHRFDRRAMLAYSAAGGAALAEFFGAANETMAGQRPPRPATRMRRVVTGHNSDGKSYI